MVSLDNDCELDMNEFEIYDDEDEEFCFSKVMTHLSYFLRLIIYIFIS